MAVVLVRRLIEPTPSQLDEVTAILYDAMKALPVMLPLVGGDERLCLPFIRASVAATAVGGEVWVASYGEISIAGAACWSPPGSTLMASAEQRAAGSDELVSQFSAEHKAWRSDYFVPTTGQMKIDSLGHGTAHGSWHLDLLGVLPGLQGKGIGKALLKPIEEKAALQGVPLCLEASIEDNVKLYEHLGYVVKGHTTFESPVNPFSKWVLMKTFLPDSKA